MGDGERQFSTLKSTVEAIWAGIKATEAAVSKEFGLAPFLPEQIHFVHSQELLSRYPGLDAKGRERAIAKELGAVFLVGIGGKLSDGTAMTFVRRTMMTGVPHPSWGMPV